jgi:tetratricopeptide (TPR) repeat protein
MRMILAALVTLPTVALAAGGDDSPPPKPAVSCEGSKVYDDKAKACVDPEQSSLDRDGLYLAARQLAYAGRYRDAQILLEVLPATDPGRLTYMGFTHRKLGNPELGMKFYQQAIAQDPANILARSYMGQGLVDQGKTEQAKMQLRAIRAYGGQGTWAEASLQRAIASGTTYNY